MGWNSTTRIVSKAISLDDIAAAVHYTSGDLGTLINNGSIKGGAMYKPFQNTNPNYPSDADWIAALTGANYGLYVPVCNTANLLAAQFSYLRPTGNPYWYRVLDFNHYYEGAPDWPVSCPSPSTIVANIINVNAANPCAFFVYHKTGALADKSPDASSGTSTTSAGRSSTQIDYCLAVGEVKASNGTLLTSLTNPYLGMALYQGSTYKGFAGCTSKLVASQTTRDNNMFITPLSSFTGFAAGTYTGKACIRYGSEVGGYGYIPLPNSTFTVKVGGADMYTYWKRGLSTSNTTSSVGIIRTTLSTVYITIRVQNNSGIAHQSNASNSNWILVTTVTGTVNGASISRSSRLTMNNYYPGTSTFVAIANGGTNDITFRLDRIWNSDPSQPADVVSSGFITIDAELKYNSGGVDSNFTRGADTQQAALSVTYG